MVPLEGGQLAKLLEAWRAGRALSLGQATAEEQNIQN